MRPICGQSLQGITMSPGSCMTPNRQRQPQHPGMFLWQTEKAPDWSCSQVQSESAKKFQHPPSSPQGTMSPFFSLSSISFLHSSNFVLNFCASVEREGTERVLRVDWRHPEVLKSQLIVPNGNFSHSFLRQALATQP